MTKNKASWSLLLALLLAAGGCCPSSLWSSGTCQDLETCRSVRPDGGCVLRVACADDCTPGETVMSGSFTDPANASCAVENNCHTQ